MGKRPGDQTSQQPGGTRPAPGDDAVAGAPGVGENLCPECGGSGRLANGDCPNCDGSGVVIEGIGGG